MQKEQLEIKVKRIGSSPYFRSDFLNNEKMQLQSIEQVSMLDCNQNETEIKQSQIIISNTHFKFKKEHLDLFKNVKLIIHSNSGYDNFDLEFILNFNGKIILGNEIRTNAVTTYILSALFKHFSSLPNHQTWSSSRSFPRTDFNQLKVQLIGHGAIGSKISQILNNLNVDLKIFDPFKNLTAEHVHDIDALILCSGYNYSNHHIIDELYLNRLNSSSVIINTARGELIDTNALLNFLTLNPNAYAYLDVFETEPNNFSQFHDIKNINTTSHIAGVFTGIEDATIAFEKKTIEDFLHLSENQFMDKYSTRTLKNKIVGNKII